MKKYLYIGLLFTAVQCKNSTSNENTVHETSTPAAPQASHLVTMPIEKVKRVGIELGKMQEVISTDGLRASAELAVHRDHIAMVNASTDGIVQQLNAKLHARISKGQVIATISKPDLLNVQQEYLETKDKIAFLQTEYDRYAALKDADATATKNFTKASSDLRTAHTSQELLAARLRHYQIDPVTLSPEKLTSSITLRAPSNGIITAIHTNSGAAVQLGSPVCEIMDLEQMHLDLMVFEKDLSRMKIGQKVKWHLPAQPNKEMDATVYAIDKTIDPEKRAVRVHASIKVDNQPELVAGAFAEATIMETAQSGAKSAALPEGAIVREGEQEYIFIQKSADQAGITYEKIPVQSGKTHQSLTELVLKQAAPPDAQFIVKGAYYISAYGAGVEVEE